MNIPLKAGLSFFNENPQVYVSAVLKEQYLRATWEHGNPLSAFHPQGCCAGNVGIDRLPIETCKAKITATVCVIGF